MAEFAKKQNDFWKREKERMETDENVESMEESEIPISKQEYDCVICNIRYELLYTILHGHYPKFMISLIYFWFCVCSIL